MLRHFYQVIPCVGLQDDVKKRWLIASLTLPVPAAVLIPAALTFLFRAKRRTPLLLMPSGVTSWLGATAGVVGLTLAVRSALAFARFGEGTPAPWDPPKRFVAYGPYRFVRNPMILGVFFILLGEALLLRSAPLFAWFAFFVFANCLYIPLVEEKSLRRRFGSTCLQYTDHVPRWFPRRTAWHSAETAKRER